MWQGVDGKVAFITGAGSDIGRTTARVLAKGGADIAVTDINLAGAEETAQIAAGLDRKALALQVDVSDLHAVDSVATQARRELGAIDSLFSNAGIGTQVAFTDMTEEDWMFDIHLNGTSHCFRAVLPGMKTTGWGRLITTSSMGALTGGVRLTHYCAAKAGIAELTVAMASELA